jgi:hypothetical protein
MSTTFALVMLTPLSAFATFAGVGSAEHVMRGLRCTLLAAGVHPSVNVWEVVLGLAYAGSNPTKSTPTIIQANSKPVFFLTPTAFRERSREIKV